MRVRRGSWRCSTAPRNILGGEASDEDPQRASPEVERSLGKLLWDKPVDVAVHHSPPMRGIPEVVPRPRRGVQPAEVQQDCRHLQAGELRQVGDSVSKLIVAIRGESEWTD